MSDLQSYKKSEENMEKNTELAESYEKETIAVITQQPKSLKSVKVKEENTNSKTTQKDERLQVVINCEFFIFKFAHFL
jgi:hypothetical protein